MRAAKQTKRSRANARLKRVKKAAKKRVRSGSNVGHINTYGHWVSEMPRVIREDKRRGCSSGLRFSVALRGGLAVKTLQASDDFFGGQFAASFPLV